MNKLQALNADQSALEVELRRMHPDRYLDLIEFGLDAYVIGFEVYVDPSEVSDYLADLDDDLPEQLRIDIAGISNERVAALCEGADLSKSEFRAIHEVLAKNKVEYEPEGFSYHLAPFACEDGEVFVLVMSESEGASESTGTYMGVFSTAEDAIAYIKEGFTPDGNTFFIPV